MSKIICSPGAYIQGKGELKKLADYYRQLGSEGAYIIVDKFIYDTYKDQIEGSFISGNVPYEMHVFGGECSDQEINGHAQNLGSCDVILGIGGGKTLDTAKATGYHTGHPVMIIPTAASSDAPCSRLSVVYTETHEFDHYLPLPKNPDMVIMDTDVIAKAPVRFLMAGIGDALATCYEAEACLQSNTVTMAGGHITKAAITLARLCKETLLEDGLKAKAAAEQGLSTMALENVVEANTYLSGIGFESSGLAAAHAIHNGMTVIEETHHLLHGEKVAFGALTQMVLENRSLAEIQEIIRFCRACGLPTTFADLGMADVSDEKLLEAAVLSCDKDDTMGNMPFEVTPEDVVAAMKTADRFAASM